MDKLDRMESVIRNVVEPFFENILKRLAELDRKIIIIDTKMTKMENEILVLGCKIDSRIPEVESESSRNSKCIMEEVD